MLAKLSKVTLTILKLIAVIATVLVILINADFIYSVFTESSTDFQLVFIGMCIIAISYFITNFICINYDAPK